MGSSKQKAETLGMPHGTATSKLRKNILFSLLQKYKEDDCYRCGAIIETVDDLSIEHKEPWEGVSADLFWNLDNIAFSHVRCNRPHRKGSGTKRSITDDGKLFCSRCGEMKDIDEFYKNTRNSSGRYSYCKPCS